MALFRVLVGFAFPFIAFIASISVRYYKNPLSEFPKYITNVLLVITTNFVIVGILVWLLSNPISSLSSFPQNLLWIIVLYVFVFSFFRLLLLLQIVFKKPVTYGILQITQSIVGFLLIVLFVVAFNKGWKGGISGDIIAMSLSGLFPFFFFFKKEFFKLSFNFFYFKFF